MVLDKITLGSKKPKKEISIDVQPKHIVYFFLFLILLVFIVYSVLIKFGFYEVEELAITCNDGTYVEIAYNQTQYCGEHYSVLKDYIHQTQYEMMEDRIYGRE